MWCTFYHWLVLLLYKLACLVNVIIRWDIFLWFIFLSFSTTTFLKSWFLRDGNVVFFLLWFFKIYTTFFLSWWVNINVGMQVSRMFWFSVFYASIRVAGLSWAYSSQQIRLNFSVAFRSENQSLSRLNLAWSVSLLLILNLSESVQISIILFLYSLSVGLLFK